MKSVRKISRAQSLLFCLNLLVLFVILFHLNFAHGSVQKSVDNNLNSIVESNYMSYLKSLDVLNPTNQDSQKSQKLSSESVIVLSNNLGHSQYRKIVTGGPYLYTLWMDDTKVIETFILKGATITGQVLERQLILATILGDRLIQP